MALPWIASPLNAYRRDKTSDPIRARTISALAATSKPHDGATVSDSREHRIDQAVAQYLQAIEVGKPLEREAWLARHTDLRADLERFLADQSAFRHAAKPIDDDKTMAPIDAILAPDPMKVRYFGDYELQVEIARGGMGVVWRARQVSLNRPVALKMILAGQLASAADVQRFKTEAEAAANLDHPNILPIYEVGEHEGQQYFSMKLIDGGSLADAIHSKSLTERPGIELLEKVCRAVHFAHRRGILHRDLKPANVLLDRTGTPYVTDFGLAKRVESDSGLTHTGALLGTPSYMAPEQARAEKQISTGVDVYALGAILYEMLTDQPPFRGPTQLDTLLQVLDQEPTDPRKLNPKSNRDLSVIALKCLEKDPTRRYGSAESIAEELARFLAGDPVSARPLGEWESAVRWAKKRPITAVLTILLVIGTLLVQLLYTVMGLTGGIGGAREMGFVGIAFAAWPAGFLGAMAILVYPRRWIVVGVVLFLITTIGLPSMAQQYLTGAEPSRAIQGVPNAAFVALGLGVGVILGAVYGGMSRWIARRRKTDMLTVFFGGVLGATSLVMLTGCLIQIPLLLFLGGNRVIDPDRKWMFLVPILLLMFIVSLFGFWLGGTFVSRFVQRRLTRFFVSQNS